MDKYFVSELLPETRYSIGKFRQDLEQILLEEGYSRIRLTMGNTFITKLHAYYKAWSLAAGISKGSFVFFHFPVHARIFRLFFDRIFRKATTIAFVHDLDGFRDQKRKIARKEIRLLSRFKVIIVHNEVMKELLETKLPTRKVITIRTLDFLAPERPVPARSKTLEISFAGNLKKSSFLSQIDQLSSLHFHLYGIGNPINTARNCTYHGIIDPIDLPFVLKGSFGLVWDGISIETCSGNFGNYLRYNFPYKTATYIMAGLPLIVWNESALADFVMENKIGIAVSSLKEIPSAINNMPEEAYQSMISRLAPLREGMRQGIFFRNVLSSIKPIN